MVPLRHTNTSKTSNVRKRKSGRRQRKRERSSRQTPAAEAAAHFFVLDIYLLLCLFFFFPKDMETWPSNREVSERFLFYNALKLFPYG